MCSSVYSSPGLSLTSPGSLHNLTVTYHYINSPISCKLQLDTHVCTCCVCTLYIIHNACTCRYQLIHHFTSSVSLYKCITENTPKFIYTLCNCVALYMYDSLSRQVRKEGRVSTSIVCFSFLLIHALFLCTCMYV